MCYPYGLALHSAVCYFEQGMAAGDVIVAVVIAEVAMLFSDVSSACCGRDTNPSLHIALASAAVSCACVPAENRELSYWSSSPFYAQGMPTDLAAA